MRFTTTNSSEATRRVVITGLGVISPIGLNPTDFWRSLSENSPAAASRHRFGEIQEFSGSPDEFAQIPPAAKKTFRKALKLMDRETLLGVAAAHQALVSSGVGPDDYDPRRIGVCFGADNISILPEDFLAGVLACTSREQGFEFDQWGAEGMPKVAPLWLLKCLPNMPACHLAILDGVQGPNNTITQRDISANLAIAEAFHAIQDGDAEAMIVGAAGTTLEPFSHVHARLRDELAEPQNAEPPHCIPFDRRRIGPPASECAAAVILEEWNSAIQRGAEIFGEIRGAAAATTASRTGSPDCQAALARSIRTALKQAGMSSDQVGHVHAHGLSTTRSDIAEARAIRKVFGDRADELPVVAAKSYLGNASAGSGGVELVASLLALRQGTLFPIRNFQEPDPECPIRPVTTYDEPAGSSFLNLNMVRQGLASCVAVNSHAPRVVRMGVFARKVQSNP